MPDAAASAIAHPRIHNGRPMQKSTMAEIAEVSGDAPKGHPMGCATYRKRARPQLVKTLIATVERFTDSGKCAADGYQRPRCTCHNYREVERFPERTVWLPMCEIGYLPSYLPSRPLNDGTQSLRRNSLGGTISKACALVPTLCGKKNGPVYTTGPSRGGSRRSSMLFNGRSSEMFLRR